MMDFDYSPAQEAVRAEARAYCAAHLAPNIAAWDAGGGYPRAVLEAMGQAGLLGGPVPRAYGGRGLDYHAFALICEELERVDSSFRVLQSVHVGLNSLTLLQWGTDDQRRRWLVPQARGEKLATFSLTEPSAGSDAGAIQCRAERQGDHYLLNGQKRWISIGNHADHILVIVTLDPALRHRGLCALILERDMPGITTGKIEGKLGVRAGDSAWMNLENVRVPASHRLGEEGEGFTIAMSAIDQGRYTVAAGAVGLATACLEASVAYASERHTFGKPIGQHQLVQQMIARMVAGIDTSRLLVNRTGHLKNHGRRSTRETSLAKWQAVDASVRAAEDAVEVHGANGYTTAYPVERYLRNARGAAIYEGTREVHTLLQAEYALGYRVDRPLRRAPWPADGVAPPPPDA
ncbi:MAG: acyl-CoA dehydrogenase family protein [Chloroflexi bacterium]|nr:acyl-CoA dehydrogenase family protein [Chloroflexota bacterium]